MSTVHFYTIPAHGHVNPTLPLIGELVLRGEKVTVYTCEPFRAKFEAQGAIPTYAANSKKVGDEMRSAGGYQRAADEIASFMRL